MGLVVSNWGIESIPNTPMLEKVEDKVLLIRTDHGLS